MRGNVTTHAEYGMVSFDIVKVLLRLTERHEVTTRATCKIT
jgi:hypothetical protein